MALTSSSCCTSASYMARLFHQRLKLEFLVDSGSGPPDNAIQVVK